MLDSLNFVKGAVTKKNLTPVLSFFKIKEGRIIGSNGELTLCAPIELGLEAQPKAEIFYKAIDACKKETTMHMTKTGRVAVKSGNFKAYVPCTEDPYPDYEPEGDTVLSTGTLLEGIEELVPFMGVDASRPWSSGILLSGDRLLATNNVVLLEYKMQHAMECDPVIIPARCVRELLRIGTEPLSLMVSERSMTFNYTDFRWIRSARIDAEWPMETVNNLLPEKKVKFKLKRAKLIEFIEQLMPFTDETDRIYIADEFIGTSTDATIGARVSTQTGVPCAVCNGTQLLNVLALGVQLNLKSWPKPIAFSGKRIRGVMMGMQDA